MAAPAVRPEAVARSGATSKAPLDVAPPPVLAKVDRLLKDGQDAEAIRLAYLTAEADVQRAFGLKLPRQWTHREFLTQYLRKDMGYLVVLLPQLHEMFEPVRYGRPGPVSGAKLMNLLRSIYQEPSMRRLSWSIGADSSPQGGPAASRDRTSSPPGRSGQW